MEYLQSKLYAILLLSCVVLFNSNSDKKKGTVIDVDIKNPVKATEIFSDYFFLKLEPDDSQILSNITSIKKMQMDDDYIYLCDDNKSILIYDKKGKLINIISRVGRSIPEYIEINDFDVYKSNIYILSRHERKVNVYNIKGEFIKSIELDFWYTALSVYDDQKVVLFSAYFNEKEYNYVLYDYVNKVDVAKLDYFGEQISMLRNGGVEVRFNFLDNGTMLTTKEFDMNVYTLSEKGLNPIYTLNFNTDETIPTAILGKPNYELDLRLKNIMECITHIEEVKDKIYLGSRIRLKAKQYTGEIITVVNKSNNTAKAYDFEMDKEFPVVGHTLLIHDGYLIRECSILGAQNLKKYYDLDIFDGIELNEYDNPLLFFYKLR